MLQKPLPKEGQKDDNDSPTSAALKCAYELMQQRIISHPNDMMGILLFGTETSKFDEDAKTSIQATKYPHCYLLADLDVPAASDVKRLRSLIDNGKEATKLLVPSADPVSMPNVLFCANQIFTTRAPNFASRRLFIVTDNDDPHTSSKELKASAVVRAKDLYDLGVIIELFPISTAGKEFDRAKFYDDIVYRNSFADPEAPMPLTTAANAISATDGISLLQALLDSVLSRSPSKRAYYSNLPFELAPDLRITVRGYIIMHKQTEKRSCYIWLDGETPQIAVGSTTRLTDDTARTVEKTELRKAFNFGGEKISFTPEELARIRNYGDPVIRLLGFKPVASLPIWANIRPATFIYPSEDEFIGSTRTFSALHQTMLAKQKMGLAWYIPRRNATPVLAALIPGAEELNDRGEQRIPAGIWVVHLPFADDVRQNPEVQPIPAPDELVDKMRTIVQQLQLPGAVYNAHKYPNPALQWHYRILQAMALEEDLPEKPDDKTVPKYRQIDKRTGAYVHQWGDTLDEELSKWRAQHRSTSVPAKREGSEGANGTSKKIKTEDGRGIGNDEMRRRYENQTINKLTVAILKDWCKANNVSAGAGGKKAELVEAVERHFETKELVHR